MVFKLECLAIGFTLPHSSLFFVCAHQDKSHALPTAFIEFASIKEAQTGFIRYSAQTFSISLCY